MGDGVKELTKPTAYDTIGGEGGHDHRGRPFIPNIGVVALAAVTTVAVWTGSIEWGMAGAAVVGVGSRSGRLTILAALLVVIGVMRSNDAWVGLEPDLLGHFEGWALVVDDPQPYWSSTRVIFEVDGERFETWSRGRAQQLRVRTWRGGQWVMVRGLRATLDEQRSGRVAWQHVVGEFELDWASDVAPGGGIARASNRVRGAIERAGAALPDADGALYRGLVVGDDRDQPREMIDRFRASGLSHLTAVSGQNVSFVLAACGPLLRRLRPGPRLAVTVGLILWFVTLTRFEPSIVRAGAMASLSAFAYATGRERAPLRLLAVAVTALLLADPLLHRSIGFWLSVGATAGVTTVGPWIASRLTNLGRRDGDPHGIVPGWLAMPLGITLGAQVGVVIPSVLVFGRLPLVSVPANLLAVPVAGAVMLYGLPAGLLAGWIPPLAPVVMFPIRFGTRWVDTVALLGDRIEPPAPWPWVGWGVIVCCSAVGVAVGVWRGNTRQSDGDLPTDR